MPPAHAANLGSAYRHSTTFPTGRCGFHVTRGGTALALQKHTLADFSDPTTFISDQRLIKHLDIASTTYGISREKRLSPWLKKKKTPFISVTSEFGRVQAETTHAHCGISDR